MIKLIKENFAGCDPDSDMELSQSWIDLLILNSEHVKDYESARSILLLECSVCGTPNCVNAFVFYEPEQWVGLFNKQMAEKLEEDGITSVSIHVCSKCHKWTYDLYF